MELNVESGVADPDPHGSAPFLGRWMRIRRILIKGKSRKVEYRSPTRRNLTSI
jgi:hypothetical protein